LTGIKKTCDNRFSTDRWGFKECKKMGNLITFGRVFSENTVLGELDIF
jgi:hypothetical protein